jgi:hypothetical protein
MMMDEDAFARVDAEVDAVTGGHDDAVATTTTTTTTTAAGEWGRCPLRRWL